MQLNKILTILIFTVLLVSNTVNSECSLNLKDSGKNIDVNIETCTNIGTFSIGAYYDNEWKALTYRYPLAWIFAGAGVVIVLFLIYFLVKKKPMTGRKGVLVKKVRNGNRIKITVSNYSNEDLNDCIVEDNIPMGSDINFFGGRNVHREGNRLIWNIGRLNSGKTAKMEYEIKGIKNTPSVNEISFLSKNSVSAEIVRFK